MVRVRGSEHQANRNGYVEMRSLKAGKVKSNPIGDKNYGL